MAKDECKLNLQIMSFILLMFLGILIVTGCSAPMGNPEDGKRWYSMHNCFACHGPNGNDGKAPVVNNLGMSYWRFERIVRNAGSPIMPKYPEEKISDQDVADLYAFLKAK
ncbi:MAG: cytochrome c [Desulfofustis sp.]|nr:cytochrome c [Desulfofustis sp.]